MFWFPVWHRTIFSVMVLVNLTSTVWKVSAKFSPLIMFTFPYVQVKIQYIFLFSLLLSHLFYLFKCFHPGAQETKQWRSMDRKSNYNARTRTLWKQEPVWNIKTTDDAGKLKSQWVGTSKRQIKRERNRVFLETFSQQLTGGGRTMWQT